MYTSQKAYLTLNNQYSIICLITFLTEITENIQRMEKRGNNKNELQKEREEKMPGVQRRIQLPKERDEEGVKEGVRKVPFH